MFVRGALLLGARIGLLRALRSKARISVCEATQGGWVNGILAVAPGINAGGSILWSTGTTGDNMSVGFLSEGARRAR